MKIPFQRFLRNRRGGASVAIAVMMAMIVAIYYIHNILLWGQMLSDQDRDRLNEKIEIVSIKFPDEERFMVTVKNVGSVTARIVRMYLEKPMPSLEILPPYPIGSGYLDLEGSKRFTISPSPVNSMDEFTIIVVTERGNLASRIYRYEPTLPEIGAGVGEWGVFRVDWFYSKYTSKNYTPSPEPWVRGGNRSYAEGGEQWDAVLINKGEQYVAFYVWVTNVYTRPCIIRNSSLLALPSLQPTAVLPNFFIVKKVDYSPELTAPEITPYDSDPYRVLPGQEVLLIFAAESEGSSDWIWGKQTKIFLEETTTEGSGIQISLFYSLSRQVGGETIWEEHGQTISTQAVILEAKPK